mmetsp:Transcript_2778/g.5058  ORF Transcript_2778/g.5058 Transcript_2778/m.5058 type:complete len:287 (-) Transcript_2778:140-1000(-)
MEKKAYSGPWKVKIKKKEPSMPSPPGSAFSEFANKNRSYVQKFNPHFKSKEIRRVLANMWKEAGEDERTSYIERERNRRETYETKMKTWIERAGYERVVTEQVPEAEVRADETVRLDPADNHHHEEEAVQQNNEARAEESCAAFDHLIDAYYVNNTIKHAIMNGTPKLEAEVGTITDEVMMPLVPYRDNEEAAAQQQNYAPQQQQGTFALFHDHDHDHDPIIDNNNINSAPDHMHFEPNTVFYHKYTAAAQFGSFGLYCESSGPGMLKKDDPEMRQLYLDLAMLVC